MDLPFMELLLPVFLKLFPNMLPSTFQDKMKEQEALKRRLNARIQYAKFVQHTIKEMAKEIQNSQNGEMKKTAEDLDEFMNKVSAPISNDQILVFAKLFNDELTLDNISRLVLLPLVMFQSHYFMMLYFSNIIQLNYLTVVGESYLLCMDCYATVKGMTLVAIHRTYMVMAL
ncbi:Mitochondrial proton/calcium exchanger protein [Glycine soja]